MTMPANNQPDDLDDDDLDGAGNPVDDQQQDTWTPPASQAELDKMITSRLRRETAKFKDYDVLKSKAEQFDSLAAASQTDQERAVVEAQEAAYNAAMAQTVPRLVRAEFRAAAKGVLDDAQLEALIEDVDLTRYVSDEGEPDVKKIARKIGAVAPKTPPPSFGQGNRGEAPKNVNMNDWIRGMAGKGRTG